MAIINFGPDLPLDMASLLIQDDHQGVIHQRNEQQSSVEPRASNSSQTEANTGNILRNRSICLQFIADMNSYGISVVDSFLGNEHGNLVYEEVINLHRAGLFTDGQLVRNDMKNKNIRGDEVIWLMGNETGCPHINSLINEVDKIVKGAGKFANNGLLGKYKISDRTRAMVACYPGNGAHYVKHVDNPDMNGRVLTAIYYLNKNWDSKVHGGMLRIFPSKERPQPAAIDPYFDRMIFFWSDRRSPHEVLPSFRTRYAITIWYYDSLERKNYEVCISKKKKE